MLSVDRHPPASQLRNFGLLLLLFVPLFGALVWWRTGQIGAAQTVWSAGGVLTAVYWALPFVRRPIFVGWMYAAFPIGWTISHLLMGAIYYLVITPIGLLIRANGRDPLLRSFDRSAQSYWSATTPTEDVRRYFRQY